MNGFGAMLQHIACLGDDGDRIIALTAWLRSLEPGEQKAAITLLATPPRKAFVALKTLRERLAERIDSELFDLSLAHVGDLAETLALLWEADTRPNRPVTPATFLHGLATTGPLERRTCVEQWLDGSDPAGRLAILRLASGTRGRPVPPGVLAASLEHLGLALPGAAPAQDAVQADLFPPPAAGDATRGTVTAILLYVETTRGARPRLVCTFGVKDSEAFVPVARLDAGDHRSEIAAFAREHPGRRFGTTQQVDTTGEHALLATLSWTGISTSTRRRAGIELHGASLVAVEAPASPARVGSLAELTSMLPSPRTRGY